VRELTCSLLKTCFKWLHTVSMLSSNLPAISLLELPWESSKQNLLFPHGQAGGFVPDFGLLAKGFDHATGNLAGHRRPAPQHVQQGGVQIFRLRPLQADSRPRPASSARNTNS